MEKLQTSFLYVLVKLVKVITNEREERVFVRERVNTKGLFSLANWEALSWPSSTPDLLFPPFKKKV